MFGNDIMNTMMWCTAMYGAAAYLFQLVFDGFVFRKLRFITDVDPVATRQAVAFLKNRRGTWFTTALANDADTVPIDWMVNPRELWIAFSGIAVGQRRYGEEHTTDLVVWVPRWWRTLPPELVVGKGSSHSSVGLSDEPDEPDEPDDTVKLKVMSKMTSDYGSWEVDSDPTHLDILNCPPAARVAAEAMRAAIKARTHMVFYVNGPPDTGKSTSVMILAHLLGGTFVDSYDCTNPSHKIDRLIKDAKPNSSNPLVISLNEADDTIARVLRRSRRRAQKGDDESDDECQLGNPQADVYNKTTLNNLLDRANYSQSLKKKSLNKPIILVLSGNTPFRRLTARFGGDASITKPTRIRVINVGGDAEYDREPEKVARDAEKVARGAEEDDDTTLTDPVTVRTPSISSECSEGTGSDT